MTTDKITHKKARKSPSPMRASWCDNASGAVFHILERPSLACSLGGGATTVGRNIAMPRDMFGRR